MNRKTPRSGTPCAGILIVAALLPLSGCASGHAPMQNAPVRVAVVNKGLALSLSLPGRTYRRGSRVTATMSLRNVSAHSIRLAANVFSPCGRSTAPMAVVMQRRVQVFPSLGVNCPIPSRPVALYSLKAGHRLTSRETIVVAGPQVRAFVFLPDHTPRGLQHTAPMVATPILTLNLSA